MRSDGKITSRIKSIGIALEGIKYVFSTQQNVRIHGVITLAVLGLGVLFRIERVEWVSLVLVIGMVWTAEIFNTAVEVIVDLVSPEHSQGAKIVKDVSAGAVLVSALISILVGLALFGPRLWFMLSALLS
jgi:diacylglycerol kinase (ATP)